MIPFDFDDCIFQSPNVVDRCCETKKTCHVCSAICTNNKCRQSLTSEYPFWLDALLDAPCSPPATQLEYSWSLTDHSNNIYIKKEDMLTLHRQREIGTTDACRGRRGVSRGIHVWKITWPHDQRGTDAVIGVATENAPLYCVGYHSLVGDRTNQSWGWNIVRLFAIHNSCTRPYPSCPHDGDAKFLSKWYPKNIPDEVFMVLDMEEGSLSFVVNNRFLGNAFTGLQGRTLYPIISSVYGDSEVTLTYINGLMRKFPLSPLWLCDTFDVNLCKNNFGYLTWNN